MEILIAGPNVYICNECVGLCNDILEEEREKRKEEKDSSENQFQDSVKPAT